MVASATSSAAAELANISGALMDALLDARGLAQAGEYGEQLRDVVTFCRDLVALADETLAADPQAGEHARGLAMHMAEQLAALEALLPPIAGS